MPIIEMERLSSDSSPEQVQAAISSCIASEVRGGMEQEQAVAACYSMAREKGAPVSQQGGV
jgi:hypothetical protein